MSDEQGRTRLSLKEFRKKMSAIRAKQMRAVAAFSSRVAERKMADVRSRILRTYESKH